nr:hypothetical protein CFP56_12920 [Quercus suber]
MTLVVGAEEQKLLIHRDILCEHSAFFKAAASEQWKEGQTLLLTLPDDDSDVLDLYIHWIYQGKIYSRTPVDISGKESNESETLVRAFVFGEKIQDGHFKDAVIDALLASVSTPDKDGACWYPTDETVNSAYADTPEGSPLRRLLLDMHIHHGTTTWVRASCGADFLVDLTKELFSLRKPLSGPDPTEMTNSSCHYHHHQSNQDCYSRRSERLQEKHSTV